MNTFRAARPAGQVHGRSGVVTGASATTARPAGSDERETAAVTGLGAPFAAGSVSLRLYPHLDLAAADIVDELRTQATLAVAHGFDGVMTSEHHGGFAGYLPNPLQAAGFALDAMPSGWAAPCPLLLLLRPTALVIEETAWLAARHPGRVGLGVASGALPADFEIMDVTMDDLTARYTRALQHVARVLGGGDAGPLANDPAVVRCREHPVPILSAAASRTAARRAAATGVGLMFDSLTTPGRCRELVDVYRDAGGSGPTVLIRRAWIGEPPVQQSARQLATYRSYAPAAAAAHWGTAEMAAAPDPASVAAQLVAAAATAGADALNLRVHVPGVTPAEVRAQVERLGADVAPTVRDALYRGGVTST
jgi:alkanesulfonate monooxygenase SsuD/methylene tetrahydromethanopterin reductase-like flavin-dependent oxidoreductase (luciferase family)